jgi:hypothetical protein
MTLGRGAGVRAISFRNMIKVILSKKIEMLP